MTDITVAEWYASTGLVGKLIIFFIVAPIIILIFTSVLSTPRSKIQIPLILITALIVIPAVLVIGTILLSSILGFIVPLR